MNVSTKLRNLRKENKLTLKELSTKSGISVSFISDVENKRRNPSIDTLQTLADALGVSVNYFFDDNSTTKQNKTTTSRKSTKEIDTIAAHLEGKDITPQKMKLLKSYIDALFSDDD